jgi:outer membrane protein assembly factor BamB
MVFLMKHFRNFPKFVFLFCISFFASASAFAADWNQWRGANRDGIVTGFNAPGVWAKELKEQWRVTVGLGHSSPLVIGNRVFIFARQDENEVLLCLDSATGKEVWRVINENIPYTPHQAALFHGKGPKSTPVYWKDKIYTLGIAGILSAHDAKTGKVIWRKEFSKEYPKTSPMFGTATSPIIDNGLLIAHVGGHDKGALTAFDAETGAVKWVYDGDGPAYSSPIIVTLAGIRQVITYTQKEFVGVNVANGKKLWSIPSKTQYDENCVTPVLYKDTLIFPREEQGISAIRIVKKGEVYETQEVWKNSDNELYMSTPVLNGNLLFGLSSKKKGQFFSVDADTGKTLWQSEGRMGENAAILNTGKVLLFLTNDANLFVVGSGAKSFEQVAKYTVATSPTWAHPVLLGNRILVKDEKTLSSFSF